MSALSAAQSISGCHQPKSEVDNIINFFNDPDNAKAVAEAEDKLGGAPPNNRPSYHTGLGMFGKWHDFCDWEAVYDFYNYAKIAADFPKLPASQPNCGTIKSALVGLQDVKASALAARDDRKNKAVDMKISEYNALYASLSCDQYFIDQERMKAEEMAKRQEELAAKLQSEAFDKASGTIPTEGSKTGTYVLYGFVGLSAIIFLTVLLKKD